MHMMQALSKSVFWVVYIYIQLGPRWWFCSHLFNLHVSFENCFMTSQYDVFICIYVSQCQCDMYIICIYRDMYVDIVDISDAMDMCLIPKSSQLSGTCGMASTHRFLCILGTS